MNNKENKKYYTEKIKDMIKDKNINKITIGQIEKMANALDMPIIDAFNILFELIDE